MIKDLLKEEKELGATLRINDKGTMKVWYKIMYHDKHHQRVIAYMGPCNDGKFRIASHNNSCAKIRIMKGSRSKTAEQAMDKLYKEVKRGKQITPQWL